MWLEPAFLDARSKVLISHSKPLANTCFPVLDVTNTYSCLWFNFVSFRHHIIQPLRVGSDNLGLPTDEEEEELDLVGSED